MRALEIAVLYSAANLVHTASFTNAASFSMGKDYYGILGVAKGVGEAELKKGSIAALALLFSTRQSPTQC